MKRRRDASQSLPSGQGQLIAAAITLGVKTVLVCGYLADVVRHRETVHLPSAFSLIDLAKEAWLRESIVVLQSADRLAYHDRPIAKNDLN